MTFEHVWLVWLGALAPVLVISVYLLDRQRQRVLMERLGELPAVQRMMAARSPGRRAVKAVLFGLALGLVVVAAARPQIDDTAVSRRKGMDLVIALDVSKSMLVGDVEIAQPRGGWPEDLDPDQPRPVPKGDLEWVQGTRLERARQMLVELARKLPDDRISVVVYAGASIHFPLTDDEELAIQLFHLVGPTDLMGGSDIGEAMRVGKCLLRTDLDDASVGCYGIGARGHGGDPLPGDPYASKKRGKVEVKETQERGRALLVVTDGGASSSTVADEVDQSRQLGISLFFVGIGSDKGGTVPELDWEGKVTGPKVDGRGQPVVSKLDREGLVQLAEMAGGKDGHYVEMASAGTIDVARIVEALGEVQRGELERTEHDKRRELYHFPLFTAFMLLAIEAAIGLRRRVNNPEADL